MSTREPWRCGTSTSRRGCKAGRRLSRTTAKACSRGTRCSLDQRPKERCSSLNRGKVDSRGPSSLECPSPPAMSHQSLRHYVLVLVLALVPLLPAIPAQAASAPTSAPVAGTPAAATPGLSAARIAAIRDSGPPVMQEAAQFEDSARVNRLAARTPTATPLKLTTATNPRLYREVFGFAFASSLGDPTIGYPSWNMSLLSTAAYFSLHVDWNGQFSG